MSFNAKSSLPEDSEANRQNKSDGKIWQFKVLIIHNLHN
jgi:hypothetical protein